MKVNHVAYISHKILEWHEVTVSKFDSTLTHGYHVIARLINV